MMNKKRVIVPILLGVIALFVYLFYDATPKPFPDNKQAMMAINKFYTEANVSEIIDVILLDSKHVFVPFISGDDHYGMSFWEWDKFQWRLGRIDTRGHPYIWKIHEKDASTHFIVWNMDPKDELNELKYYLIGERDFHSSDDLETYRPRVQMEKAISLQKQTYGVLPLPKDWVELMNGNFQLNNTNQSTFFFQMMSPSSTMHIGWIPYGYQGKETFPENTVNGGSFGSDRINVDFVPILNEEELELSQEIINMMEGKYD